VTRAIVGLLVAMACLRCAPLPDPGRPCERPVEYSQGTWYSVTGEPIADTMTEDSAPYAWHCVPSADLVRWFGNLDN